MNITAHKRAGLWSLLYFWFLILAACLLAVLLSGCGGGGLLPTKRTETAAVKTAEDVATKQSLVVEKITEGEKSPLSPVTITGSSNTVSVNLAPPPPVIEAVPLPRLVSAPTQPAPAASMAPAAPVPASAPAYRQTLRVASGADQTAVSTEAAQSSLQVSLPLGISLGLLVLALLGLLYFVKKARQSSRAFDAAFTVGDNAVAGFIARKESELRLATDPATQARLAAELAELEKQRGKLNKI